MTKEEVLRLPEYLGHIVDAIDRVHRYVKDMTEPAFLQDEKTQDAVIRNFEVIGEASNNVKRHYAEFHRQHPELPLNFAYEMRNALAHGYHKVDLIVVWTTIHGDLPNLRNQVATLIAAPTLAQSSLAELMRNPLQVHDFKPLSRDDANER